MREWYWVEKILRVSSVWEWVYEKKNEGMRTVELEKEWINANERQIERNR